MRKRTASGRIIDRFCDHCGRWCGMSQRSRMWTRLGKKREDRSKDEPMYCTVCLPPDEAQKIVVRLATVITRVDRSRQKA